MRVYAQSYRETMNLPMKVFWQLSGSVPRLIAGERKDYIETITAATHNLDQAHELFLRLDELSPDPVTYSGRAYVQAAVRDEAGFAELKSMAG